MTAPFAEGCPSRPCPLCGDGLAITPLEASSALTCYGCGGRWLGPEDLEGYLNRLAADPKVMPSPFLNLAGVIVQGDMLERPRSASRCPDCRETLELLNYGYDSNIMLERCPYAHGVWLRAEQLRPLASLAKGNQRLEPLLESLRAARRVREAHESLRDDVVYATTAIVPFVPIWFFPYDTDRSRRSPAVVTAMLILLNVLVYWLQPQERWFVGLFALRAAVAPLLPWTIVTHMFLHGGFLHLAFNMFFLWLFGRDVEDELGPARFRRLYFLSGIAAAAGQFAFSLDFHNALLGASGAISGVLGAFFYLFPGARIVMRSTMQAGEARPSAKLFLGLWFIKQVHHAFTLWSHVAWFSHVAGFLAGMALAAWHRKKAEESAGLAAER